MKQRLFFNLGIIGAICLLAIAPVKAREVVKDIQQLERIRHTCPAFLILKIPYKLLRKLVISRLENPIAWFQLVRVFCGLGRFLVKMRIAVNSQLY